MSTKQTSVARTQKPQPRPADTQRDNGLTINVNSNSPNDQRHNQVQDEQPDNPPKPDKDSEPEAYTGPPLYEQPQVVRSNRIGQNVVATAVAASLFARFNPNDTELQPAELYDYQDTQYAERGYI